MKKFLISTALFAIILALLLEPEFYLLSALNGVRLFGLHVFPSIFPFLVFSGIIQATNAMNSTVSIISRPFKRIFGVFRHSGYNFFISILCGYPIGAKLTSDIYKNFKKPVKNCVNCGFFVDSKNQDRNLDFSHKNLMGAAALSSTAGVIFVLNQLMGLFNGNIALVAIILLCHYAAALLTALFFSSTFAKVDEKNAKCKIGNAKFRNKNSPLEGCPKGGVEGNAEYRMQNISLSSTITTTIKSSIMIAFTIGGFMIIFNMLIDMLLRLELLNLPLYLLTRMTGNRAASYGILLSIFELSRGLVALCASTLPLGLLAALSAALISFGGIPIILQSMAFLARTGLKTKSFIMIKCLHAAIAMALTWGAMWIIQ